MLTSHGEGDENLTDFEEEEDYRVVSRHSNSHTNEDQYQNRHWLWGNWILLAMIATLSFSTCNIFIGEISDLGMQSVNYFCTGSLFFSIGYFIYQREWAKLNPTNRGMLDS